MISKVKAGTPVQVTLDALNSSFAATVSQVVPATDPAHRTFTAKINLNRKGLTSGMFGRGAIALGTGTNSILVPGKAVVERGALTSVWTVDKDHLARLRLVKTGKTRGETVEILAGLSPGERILVSGLEKVSDGAKVE
jgi:RND family efflux transporter MFP subunit